MTPAQEFEINRISQTMAAAVTALHKESPTSPELIVASAVDFLAACIASLHSPEGIIRESLVSIVHDTLNDRIHRYTRTRRHTLSVDPMQVH